MFSVISLSLSLIPTIAIICTKSSILWGFACYACKVPHFVWRACECLRHNLGMQSPNRGVSDVSYDAQHNPMFMVSLAHRHIYDIVNNENCLKSLMGTSIEGLVVFSIDQSNQFYSELDLCFKCI